MRFKTPFFSAFGPLLFGRRPHRRLPVIEEDFGQLAGVFGGHLPKGALAAAKAGATSRNRMFTVQATFWAFLFQVLSPTCACREAVRKFHAWWHGSGKSRKARKGSKEQMSASTSAYCQARARLPLTVLGKLFATLAATLERRILDRELWLGRRVKILDGTGLSMPDTHKNQQRWPQPKGQKPGCGFPLLRMVGLFCLSSGAMPFGRLRTEWLRYAFGNQHNQENHLARGVLDGLEKDDVLLADRGFCSFGLIGVMLARAVACVMRLHQARPRDFRQGKRLGKNDRLVTWCKNPSRKNDPWASEHASLPATLSIRLVRFRVEVPGFRTEEITLATTLLDPQKYPAEALAELYRARWNIELRYRERVARQRPPAHRGAHPAPPPERQIKTTMGAEVLRCKSPAMIEKELCMNAIGYNLIRCVMQEAAQRHDVELGRMSFKGSLDAMRHFADTIHAATGKPRRQTQLYDELLAIIASDRLPLRPDRNEPRARKRRPKPCQLLTKPRHKMRVISHRNRYRADNQGGLS